MPNYSYRARDPQAACDHCLHPFTTTQPLSAPALEACPDCDAPIRRVIVSAPAVNTNPRDVKKITSDGNLKRLGFKKLVKDGGKYVDALAD